MQAPPTGGRAHRRGRLTVLSVRHSACRSQLGLLPPEAGRLRPAYWQPAVSQTAVAIAVAPSADVSRGGLRILPSTGPPASDSQHPWPGSWAYQTRSPEVYRCVPPLARALGGSNTEPVSAHRRIRMPGGRQCGAHALYSLAGWARTAASACQGDRPPLTAPRRAACPWGPERPSGTRRGGQQRPRL